MTNLISKELVLAYSLSLCHKAVFTMVIASE